MTEQAETGAVEQSETTISPSWDELFAGESPAEVAEKLANSRKWEKRAKENVSAVRQLQELEDAKKTEIERIQERATTAEAERDANRVELTRFRLAARYGLTEDDLEFLPAGSDEEMEDRAKRLSARLKAQAPTETAPGPRPDLSQGPKGDLPLNGDPLLNDIKRKLGLG